MSKSNMPSGPATVGSLIAEGLRIRGTCNECGHKRLLTAEAMAEMDSNMRLSDVHRKMYCGACGSKNVIATSETLREVRQGRER